MTKLEASDTNESNTNYLRQVNENRSKRPYPRPRVTKLGPDDRVDWVIIAKPVLTAAIYDTTFHTFQNIPAEQQGEFTRENTTCNKLKKKKGILKWPKISLNIKSRMNEWTSLRKKEIMIGFQNALLRFEMTKCFRKWRKFFY